MTGLLVLLQLAPPSVGMIMAWLRQYGYAAIFVLTMVEIVFPLVPSEALLPAVGILASRGIVNVYLGFAVALFGSLVGISIDYAIGYYLGKRVVYRHLALLRIKKADINAFDSWFTRNGAFTVFIARLVPIARALISFPAGFARMPLHRFIGYSLLGSAIWNAALIGFGYYIGRSSDNVTLVIISAAILAVMMYALYRYGMKLGRKRGAKVFN